MLYTYRKYNKNIKWHASTSIYEHQTKVYSYRNIQSLHMSSYVHFIYIIEKYIIFQHTFVRVDEHYFNPINEIKNEKLWKKILKDFNFSKGIYNENF